MKTKYFFLLSLTGIIVVNGVLFYPSFYHIARADQLIYLIEMADLEKFSDLIEHSISFTRTRVLFTGDRLYYRPLFYLVLATERYLFKYNFMAWQITGLALHMLLLGVLLRLFNMIRPGRWLPAIFTLFFSVLYLSADMVIWHHINMYIFSLTMILLSMSFMIQYMRDINPPASLRWMISCLILASLSSEFGLVACAMLMVIMFIYKKPGQSIKDHPILLMIPMILYVSLSLLDYWMKFPVSLSLLDQGGLPGTLNPLHMIVHFLILLAIGLFAPLLPGFILLLPGERTFIVAFNGGGFLNYCADHIWLILANSALILIIMFFFAFLFKYRKYMNIRDHLSSLKAKTPTSLVLFNTSLLLAISYICVLTISRGGEDFYKYLDFSLYHFYPICLFLIIALYCVVSMVSGSGFPQRAQFERSILIILCLGGLLNAMRVHELNMRGKQIHQAWGQYIQQIEGFIQEHKHEPDFSFAINDPEYMERTMRIRFGEPSENREIRGFPSDYLFRKYINKENPKYRFSFRSVAHGELNPMPSIDLRQADR